MPDLRIENWYGMVAPAGTPPAVVAALNRIATEAMRDPAVKEKLAVQGAELVGDSPEHFHGFIDSEIQEMGRRHQGRRGRDREVSSQYVIARSQRSRPPRAKCSTKSFAGRGSVLEAAGRQIASRRLAQASRIRIIAIGIDWALRFAPRPPAPPPCRRRPPPSGRWRRKSRNRARNRRRTPSRAACLAIWPCSAVERVSPDEVAVGQFRQSRSGGGWQTPPRRRRHQHQAVLAEQKPFDIVGQGVLGGKAEIRRTARDRRGDIGAFPVPRRRH